MGDYLPEIISLVTGALGGNLAGSLMKNLSLGSLWNSITGILGGGLGGFVLSKLGLGGEAVEAASSMDVSSILGSVASGGVGGGVVMAIIGAIKNMMNK